MILVFSNVCTSVSFYNKQFLRKFYVNHCVIRCISLLQNVLDAAVDLVLFLISVVGFFMLITFPIYCYFCIGERQLYFL